MADVRTIYDMRLGGERNFLLVDCDGVRQVWYVLYDRWRDDHPHNLLSRESMDRVVALDERWLAEVVLLRVPQELFGHMVDNFCSTLMHKVWKNALEYAQSHGS